MYKFRPLPFITIRIYQKIPAFTLNCDTIQNALVQLLIFNNSFSFDQYSKMSSDVHLLWPLVLSTFIKVRNLSTFS